MGGETVIDGLMQEAGRLPPSGLSASTAPQIVVPTGPQRVAAIREQLGDRSVVLVGLMGAGKTSLGRRLAAALDLPFCDSDHAIELAAGMTIPEIFERHGEPYFRAGEARVVARLLRDGPQVLATGGGAYMHPETRARVREAGVSVWLKADLDVLMRRVRKRQNRPLLAAPDPEGVMRGLMAARDGVYGEADLVVVSHDGPHEVMMGDLLLQLADHLAAGRAP